MPVANESIVLSLAPYRATNMALFIRSSAGIDRSQMLVRSLRAIALYGNTIPYVFLCIAQEINAHVSIP
jgi:hypothetical protein